MQHPDGIHSLSFEQYGSADGVSKSMLDRLAYPKTPAHLRAYMDDPRPEPTDAMVFGTILHRALLEPDTMKGAFAIRPEGLNLRTKAGMQWAEENSDKPILSSDKATAIGRCVENLWKHPRAKSLLTGSDFERCLFASDDNGVLRKGRIDALPKAGNVLPDVKTCASAAGDDFEKSVVEYRYHVQAAYYIDLCQLLGMDRPNFVFICVEKTPPYAVAVHQLDPLVVEWGRRTYQRDLTVYRQCLESGEWPGYSQEIGVIGVPRWAQKEMEESAA